MFTVTKPVATNIVHLAMYLEVYGSLWFRFAQRFTVKRFGVALEVENTCY